ncbi:hypothetical protein ACFWNN_02155 [Lentzea sp. NPDC058450]|uniref:hypothetical protein n=1 Tax=Lentzea sp. NPDC058450 TaxID=3346505 RepID=UPI003654D52F
MSRLGLLLSVAFCSPCRNDLVQNAPISWCSKSGPNHAGVVTFQRIDTDRTRVAVARRRCLAWRHRPAP